MMKMCAFDARCVSCPPWWIMQTIGGTTSACEWRLLFTSSVSTALSHNRPPSLDCEANQYARGIVLSVLSSSLAAEQEALVQVRLPRVWLSLRRWWTVRFQNCQVCLLFTTQQTSRSFAASFSVDNCAEFERDQSQIWPHCFVCVLGQAPWLRHAGDVV
jgi:hypothetical protein